MSEVRVEFTDDAGEFLHRAGGLLAAEPVRYTVIASVATQTLERSVASDLPYRPWFATAVVGGVPTGVAMRNAPAPYPAWIGRFPPAAVSVLVDRLVADRTLTCVTGEPPSVVEFGAELARRRGESSAVTGRTRLHEFLEPKPPLAPPGWLRVAGPADADLCIEWYGTFRRDAAAQGGGPTNQLAGPTPDEIRRAIARGAIHLWECGGVPVSLVGHRAPTFGVAAVAPVYTPERLRGRGFARAAVYELSVRLRRESRVCLYTDRANPVSTAVYDVIGYRPVGDNVTVGITRPA
ncbi:GNAT family N-acetyltransferase [Skermania piniformis]|uniref:N-acetyltransferase domain-containing protein n=1 Tax=Skermania pinensis TaxID=39122 RepID=A0ABX8SC31_9ACTN|nr:GNAT family N-acetyltransferase [Skermania piniformis]QXQ14150.1 hypothetical protein KV203_01500 [Skermania piniformis]